ncbi:hypothetical protein SLEP1_g56579 [Rubroshorea leprosula]|uniref:Uncharacterized protein n=1 Tax=Rubroshorea leprosula TaxID=152421 RepID=A0AAV5MMM2_9ROSI|nr:hypothetical protein SLEP1_g56579 [Rubroshorea leprosula]
MRHEWRGRLSPNGCRKKLRGRGERMPKCSESQIKNRVGYWVLLKGRARVERLEPKKEIEGQ